MREDLTSRFSIKDVGCMHPDDKQTTHCVNDDMSLPALDKLATVEAGFDRCLRCPSDALAINDGAAWLRISTFLLAQACPQRCIDLLQHAAVRPFVVVVIDKVVRRKIFRQIAPRAACLVQIENGIQNLAQVRFSATPCLVGIKLVQNRLDGRPFFVRKVAWITDRYMSIVGSHFDLSEYNEAIRIKSPFSSDFFD